MSSSPAKVKRACRTVVRKVKVKRRVRRRKVKVCTPVAKKRPPRTTTKAKAQTPVTAKAPARPKPTTSASAALPAPAALRTPAVAAAPVDPPAPDEAPVPVFSQPLAVHRMARLLWRAGFGPRAGEAARLAGGDVTSAVLALTRPSGAATLTGPAPTDEHGAPLRPGVAWGHDHLSWLDRMVRGDQPLVERMTLIWHDWFATSGEGIDPQQLVLDQNATLRAHALGRFDDLFAAVTCDPAMLKWLNGNANAKASPNENYAREMMELFSLGAGRGAYTEGDLRELARALTGWCNDWTPARGSFNFRYDPSRHDAGPKTVFGHTGAWDWRDAVRLCVEHPLHASFFVTKLWSYFVPVPPDDATLASLQGLYLGSGREIRPVVEAILQHPALYDGPSMVIPPVVYTAGLLRALERGIDTSDWVWLANASGQLLFRPPGVQGWDDTRWLDTSTIRGRWLIAYLATKPYAYDPWAKPVYDPAEDAATAVTKAMAFLGNPGLSAETQAAIAEFAVGAVPASTAAGDRGPLRAMRQNALRMLIATAPDAHIC